MYEIEPIKIRDKVKKDDKRPLEKIIKEEAYKIGFDPCYFIIAKEGFFAVEQEFLYFQDTVYQAENIKSTTCEICGRLVIGNSNEPKALNFKPKQQAKPLCKSCIESYKGWDNYEESNYIIEWEKTCEDCGKQTFKSLIAVNVEVKACDECSAHLNNIGFENVASKNIHSTPLPIKQVVGVL